MRKTILIIVALGTYLSADFTRNNATAIVTDSESILEWQDSNDVNSTIYTWEEAISYCESLTFSNHNDWRLPHINELSTIIDRTKKAPAIANEFQYTKFVDENNSTDYWSSTTVLGVEGKKYARLVNFYYGSLVGYNKVTGLNGSKGYVRCVRNR